MAPSTIMSRHEVDEITLTEISRARNPAIHTRASVPISLQTLSISTPRPLLYSYSKVSRQGIIQTVTNDSHCTLRSPGNVEEYFHLVSTHPMGLGTPLCRTAIIDPGYKEFLTWCLPIDESVTQEFWANLFKGSASIFPNFETDYIPQASHILYRNFMTMMAVDCRTRVKSAFRKDAARYFQLSCQQSATSAIRRIGNAILRHYNEQATEEQLKAYASLSALSIRERITNVLFGDKNMAFQLMSNWLKANIFNGIDFSLAILNEASTQERGGKRGHPTYYHSTGWESVDSPFVIPLFTVMGRYYAGAVLRSSEAYVAKIVRVLGLVWTSGEDSVDVNECYGLGLRNPRAPRHWKSGSELYFGDVYGLAPVGLFTR
ncbi:hypothetical protein BGW36DRAFT_444119 [Talaromyces proteolyticus]|uniref:Uncharacterized protein n=1 Tax=Talaromyces proteolyticus TaxID=1131652 RepID=A0AAD4Q558_9EURO|nr:uncharacterized protein BGW36DRAFT_444119 [Talaromyces proteolyticus]KAH8703685.1 hypothetical protein BGW36DRAFT_444119 [Talaromyces proteolyticus]